MSSIVVNHVYLDNDEEMVLFGDRALYLPARSTLVVSDIHLGKAASFRARNFFAPSGITERDLTRLSTLIQATGATRLLVLGDLVHAQDGVDEALDSRFSSFRELHSDCDFVLVKGNHDARVKLSRNWRLDIVKSHFSERGLVFSHDLLLKKNLYTLCGHIHPAVVLSGRAHGRERLPCFWMRGDHMILPSFGVFTGGFTILPERGDRVFVTAQGEVIEVALRRKTRAISD